MERLAIDDLDPAPAAGDAEARRLTGPLGATDVAINHYRVSPGDRISGLHGHTDQEEIFLVVGGALTFETLDDRGTSREVPVRAGEAIRFGPGTYQSGRNDGDDVAQVVAIGAPRDSEDVRIPLACPYCAHDDLRPTVADEEAVLACPDCGESVPVACPECGGEDLLAVLGEDGEPVSRCRDCGEESAPP